MRTLRSRPPLGRLSRIALPLLVTIWGCGGSGDSKSTPTTPTPTPKARQPARVVVVTSPTKTAEVRTAAGDFAVRVEDAAGAGVPGVRVDFRAQLDQPGNMSGISFAPADDVTTDSAGIARVAVTFGFLARPDRLVASAAGVGDPAMVDVNPVPGPATFVTIMPSAMRLFGAGDSATFQAWVSDRYLNAIKEAPLDIKVSDSTLLSVTPPTSYLTKGTVRALRGGGSAVISSTAAAQVIALGVTVMPNARDICAGKATPQDVTIDLIAVTDSVLCLPANARGAQYTLMVYNESTNGAASLGTTVTGYNVIPEMIPALSAARIRPSLSRSLMVRRSLRVPKPDLRFRRRLLQQSRSLRPLIGAARTARSFGRGGTMGRIRGPSYALNGGLPSVPAVDSLVALNVSTDACTTADTRTFRVEAVGSQSIVLADTANPTGGFTRADYQRFAARFDTLVYPLDVGSFDAPTDIDGNGHVAILFTRAVNELTPPDADAFVGGFFYARDLFPRTQSPTFAVCPTSNEGEMFYMMVPDPSGTVNGNQFDLGYVDTLTTSILAHEFQHLINASRRMYVNNASDFEETWLDEGLSHEAEELLFFHESGYTPRYQLNAGSILDSWPHVAAFVSDDASNFVNFYYYLSDPTNHSPIDANDEIETRGAAWAFLRYAVDKGFPSDAGVWRRFANSTTTGIGTLNFALQRDPKPVLKDFAVANLLGGHPSWNFGSIYSEAFGVGYPLPFGLLQEGAAVPVTARGGSASYWKFAVAPDAQALLRFGSSGAPPNGNLKFMIMRSGMGP